MSHVEGVFVLHLIVFLINEFVRLILLEFFRLILFFCRCFLFGLIQSTLLIACNCGRLLICFHGELSVLEFDKLLIKFDFEQILNVG